jgi:hypothetical protein
MLAYVDTCRVGLPPFHRGIVTSSGTSKRDLRNSGFSVSDMMVCRQHEIEMSSTTLMASQSFLGT